MPLRILLAEDHATVREGLKLLLGNERDMEVIGEAGDAEEAVQRSQHAQPDVVIMDLSMPGGGGLQAARVLRQVCPAIHIVSLTRHADAAFLHEAVRAGIAGYVLKQSSHIELLQAIRTVARGGQYIDPAMTKSAASDLGQPPGPRSGRTAFTPTGRETEVLRLAARGHSNKEIAGLLNLSVKTVEVHKASAMRKLGLANRTELLRYAILQGWLNER